MVPDESIVVRPPEFEKVLEELHVVRLSGHLKSEIQARRDLEDIYQRLLQDVTDLEETIEARKVDVERAEEDARRAAADQARARADETLLRTRLMRTRVVCWLLAALAAGFAVIAWQDLSALSLGLLSRVVS